MKIKIYQIDRERCNDDRLFENYDSVMNRYNEIDPSIYKTVYDGESYMSDLEGVYAQFNTERPPVFKGHSMSVSDVVEICDNTAENPKGIYFCDRIGFKKLKDFDTSKTPPLLTPRKKENTDVYIDIQSQGILLVRTISRLLKEAFQSLILCLTT